MTDVGKVPLYEGSVLDRDEHNKLLIQTGYRYEERMSWVPGWQLPTTARVDDDGFLQVQYLDALGGKATF